MKLFDNDKRGIRKKKFLKKGRELNLYLYSKNFGDRFLVQSFAGHTKIKKNKKLGQCVHQTTGDNSSTLIHTYTRIQTQNANGQSSKSCNGNINSYQTKEFLIVIDDIV